MGRRWDWWIVGLVDWWRPTKEGSPLPGPLPFRRGEGELLAARLRLECWSFGVMERGLDCWIGGSVDWWRPKEGTPLPGPLPFGRGEGELPAGRVVVRLHLIS